jgi:serine/threonine protein kinase
MEIYLDEESRSDEFKHYFEYVEYIASGSFGTVVRAIHLETGKDVAVKIIETVGKDKQKSINRLKQEINILKQLNHKNIVEFYGFIETNKQIFIIMEYIKGGTLKSLIKEKKENNFSEEEASLLIQKLLSAVEYLHSRDICHRDIKPENIIFENYDDLTSLKLIDFGLSAQNDSVLDDNEICGTLIYMAPEQVDKKLYTKGIDIWSVGIIMYMLLNNGQHPLFNIGDTSSQFIEKLKNKDWRMKIKVSS